MMICILKIEYLFIRILHVVLCIVRRMRKSTHLKSIEDGIQKNVNYDAEVIHGKPKFFGCFPYPYMNGKLHLGHAFTMLKVDFECRFKELIGYNVLFPFGFHVTGIPIYAASKKLEKESIHGNGQQYNIMKNMGIPENDIYKFTNPIEWIKYFPNLGIEHVKKLGLMVDFRRSFITTNINPFYDSFVRWQFYQLYNRGYLKFGTRNSIYSDSLEIQCQDHDRSIGEGIQNVNFTICKIPYHDGTIYIPYENQFNTIKSGFVKISSKQKYNKYCIDGKIVYMTEYVYKNYVAQKEVHAELLETNISFSEFKDSYDSPYSEYLGGEVENGDNIFNTEENISLSSSLVVDRMGEICIVKPIEQWYIDYADSEWKSMAKNCVKNMNISDYIKESLLKGIDWIKEWGVSRTFGLGTKIPFDERFIIDSLSDSTIYMAYYTISHLIHKDIYGMESEFMPSHFTNEVWDFIFYGIWNDSIQIKRDKLEKMRESFEYFYPVDIRVSGKDLLTNHLIMYIFNHCAIFSSKTPVSINCNGWVLVNGEKMAKQKGNFITIESALEENSVDAVRLTLADSGDGIDDANFETKKASDTNTLKLFSFVESVEKFYNEIDTYSLEINEIDVTFENIFNQIFKNIIDSYNSKEYKSVVRDVFYVINNLKEKYRIYSKYFNKKPNLDIMKHIIQNQIKLIFPIAPHISTYLSDKMNFEMKLDSLFKYDISIIEKYNKNEETLSYIREKFDRFKKKGKKITKCMICNIDIGENEKVLIKNQIKLDFEFTNDDSGKTKIEFSE